MNPHRAGFKPAAFAGRALSAGYCGWDSNPHVADSRSAASTGLGYRSDTCIRLHTHCRRQDSNLQPPESESGASAKLGYYGGTKSRTRKRKLQDSNLQGRSKPPGVRGRAPRRMGSELPLGLNTQRRRQDSNPPLRGCNPAPRLSATSSRRLEWVRQDSNLRSPLGLPVYSRAHLPLCHAP